VIHHDLQVLLLGQVDQLLGLRGGGGEWLLHKNVLSVFECALCQLKMRPDRSDDGDGVDVRSRQQFGTVGCQAHIREACPARRRATSLLSQIATTFVESRARRLRTMFVPSIRNRSLQIAS